MTDFWPRVWEAGRTLAESNELDERTATALRDPAVQRFVFGYKGFSDPAWFHQFRAAGLFKDPGRAAAWRQDDGRGLAGYVLLNRRSFGSAG